MIYSQGGKINNVNRILLIQTWLFHPNNSKFNAMIFAYNITNIISLSGNIYY
jgi:hypothetical protein